MTQAVCFNCGEMKFGAFSECAACGVRPSTDDDFVLSLAMTDHYFDMATMGQMGRAIKEGKPPHLDDDTRRRLLGELASVRKTPLGRFIGAAPKEQVKKKSKWWPF